MYKKNDLIKVRDSEQLPWEKRVFHNYGGINNEFVFCVSRYYEEAFIRNEKYETSSWRFNEPILLGDDHPLLVEALKNKVPIKCRVNPEQSEVFQKICFENSISWGSSGSDVRYLCSQFLYVDSTIDYYRLLSCTNGEYFDGSKSKEYDFENKRFIEPKPLGDEHPVLVDALKNKLNIKCRVSPEQCEIFQNICFENSVFWNGQTKEGLDCLNAKYIFVSCTRDQYAITWFYGDRYFCENKGREYDFNNKCFVEPKPKPQLTIEQLNGWWRSNEDMDIARIDIPRWDFEGKLWIGISGKQYHTIQDFLDKWEPISDEEVLRIINNLGRE